MALSQTEVLAGLAEIVNEDTGIATDAVALEKHFTNDLDIDSISMMTIVVNCEDKFGVKIPDEEVKNLETVGDGIGAVAEAFEEAEGDLLINGVIFGEEYLEGKFFADRVFGGLGRGGGGEVGIEQGADGLDDGGGAQGLRRTRE